MFNDANKALHGDSFSPGILIQSNRGDDRVIIE